MRMVQRRKIVTLRTPVDSTGAAQGGNLSAVSVRAYKDIVFHYVFGNVAADCAITLQQCKNVGGSGGKALAFDTIYLVKTNAGAPEDQDKAVRTTVASNSFTVANATHDNHHMMIEMQTDKLDVSNGFDCVRPELSSPAGACLVCMFVELLNPRYSGDESNLRVMPSALDQT
jgi:hypothetical protein